MHTSDVLNTSISSVQNFACSNKFQRVFPTLDFLVSIKDSLLEELQFENWFTIQYRLREMHGYMLAEALEDVESVTFSNMNVVGDLNQCILQFMPNLKELTLCKKFKEQEDVNWMEMNDPQLQRFVWHLDEEVPVTKVKRFLGVNSNVTFFSLLSRSQHTIKELIKEGVQVNELFFDVTSGFSYFETEMPQALDELMVFCKQNSCESLHLMFGESSRDSLQRNLDKLVALAPYIKGLYFDTKVINKEFVIALTKLENLKVLQYNFATNINGLMANIPNLEEIYVYWGANAQNIAKYQKSMLFFASNSPKLKKIYLRNNSQPFKDFDFKEYDSKRRQLPGARKLKIYFKSDEPGCTGPLNEIQRNFDLIEVLRVESENVKNPMINEWTVARKMSKSSFRRYNSYARRGFNYWF